MFFLFTYIFLIVVVNFPNFSHHVCAISFFSLRSHPQMYVSSVVVPLFFLKKSLH